MSMHKLFFLLSSITWILGSCTNSVDTPKEEESVEVVNTIELTKDQIAHLGIIYGDVREDRIQTTVSVVGKVDLPPQNIISINFPLGGFLKSTRLIPGMRIKKGETLAVMEDQSIVQLQQDYLSNKVRLEQSLAEYARQKNLIVENAGSVKSLQKAEAEMKVLSYAVKAMEEKLKMINIDVAALNESTISGQVTIPSPINGYVSKVFINTGKYVQSTETMFELIDPEDIHAALTLFEKDLPYVQVGKDVDIHLIEEPSVTYKGEVILVDREVGDDRTSTAHCHFKTRPTKLLPGMMIGAEISLENQSVDVLPEAAVVKSGTEHVVFVKKTPTVFEMRKVQVGVIGQGKVQILAGLDDVPPSSIVYNKAYQLLGTIKNKGEEE